MTKITFNVAKTVMLKIIIYFNYILTIFKYIVLLSFAAFSDGYSLVFLMNFTPYFYDKLKASTKR